MSIPVEVNVPEGQAAKVTKKQAYIILIVLVALNMLNWMDRTVISVALQDIKTDFNLTDGMLGILQSILYVGVGLMMLPAGVMIDRWGRKKSVALMGILWSIATVITGGTSNFIILCASRVACGAGEAGFQPGGTAWLSMVFPKKDRAKINGIFSGVGAALGSMLGMALGGFLIGHTGSWRTPFLAFGLGGIALSLVALCLVDIKMVPAAGATAKPKTSLYQDFSALFQKKTLLWAALAQGVFMVPAMSLLAWQIALMMRAYNIAADVAGGVFAVAFLPSLVGPLMGGFVADWFAKRSPAGRPLFTTLAALLAVVGFGLQAYLPGMISLKAYVGVVCIGALFCGWHVPTYQVINMDVFPPEQRGKAAATVGLFSFLIFSWWGPILVGFLSEAFGGGVDGLRYGMLCLLPFLFLSAFFSWLCKKSYVNDLYRGDE